MAKRNDWNAQRAGEEIPRIVRIQDPAGTARTFTFDRGWISIAEVRSEREPQSD